MSNTTVAQMFVLFLGRAPSNAELSQYNSQSRSNLASIVVGLPEAQQKYLGYVYYRIIQIIYIQAFARSPVDAEMLQWSRHLINNDGNVALTGLAILDNAIAASSNDINQFNSKVSTALSTPYTGTTGIQPEPVAPILHLPPCKWEVSQDKTIHKTTAKLGDGYTLDAVSTNSTRLEYSLSIAGLNTSARNSIVSTLKSYQGVTKFRWRPVPFIAYKEYICDRFSVQNNGDNVWTINATFKEQR